MQVLPSFSGFDKPSWHYQFSVFSFQFFFGRDVSLLHEIESKVKNQKFFVPRKFLLFQKKSIFQETFLFRW